MPTAGVVTVGERKDTGVELQSLVSPPENTRKREKRDRMPQIIFLPPLPEHLVFQFSSPTRVGTWEGRGKWEKRIFHYSVSLVAFWPLAAASISRDD